MKIAQIAPLAESVPPALYGGTERIVSYLTEELVAMGHDVTVFASGNSVTTAELVPVCPRALQLSAEPYDAAAAQALQNRTAVTARPGIRRRALPYRLGALTVACAMVPLGAWIAFTLTSLLLLAQGNVAAAVGLFAYGAVVALVGDYVVQPTLIGGSTRLPFL